MGLGNPLMGDDGIGCSVVERMTREAGVDADAEFLLAGCDLLRHEYRMRGCQRVILVDAMLDDQPPGTVSVFDSRHLHELYGGPSHPHHLSVAQALELLDLLSPLVDAARIRLITVSVESVQAREGLSPELGAKLARIVKRVWREVAERPAVRS
jgi:hydrogenase maturation protease